MKCLYKKIALVTASAILASFVAHAEATKKAMTSASASTDVPAGLNAMDQRHGTLQDEEITRKIRERIMSIRDLSTSAQNVKIITLDRKVSLIGEVVTQQEKNLVIQAATAVAGNNVHHEIAVRQ